MLSRRCDECFGRLDAKWTRTVIWLRASKSAKVDRDVENKTSLIACLQSDCKVLQRAREILIKALSNISTHTLAGKGRSVSRRSLLTINLEIVREVLGALKSVGTTTRGETRDTLSRWHRRHIQATSRRKASKYDDRWRCELPRRFALAKTLTTGDTFNWMIDNGQIVIVMIASSLGRHFSGRRATVRWLLCTGILSCSLRIFCLFHGVITSWTLLRW